MEQKKWEVSVRKIQRIQEICNPVTAEDLKVPEVIKKNCVKGLHNAAFSEGWGKLSQVTFTLWQAGQISGKDGVHSLFVKPTRHELKYSIKSIRTCLWGSNCVNQTDWKCHQSRGTTLSYRRAWDYVLNVVPKATLFPRLFWESVAKDKCFALCRKTGWKTSSGKCADSKRLHLNRCDENKTKTHKSCRHWSLNNLPESICSYSPSKLIITGETQH